MNLRNSNKSSTSRNFGGYQQFMTGKICEVESCKKQQKLMMTMMMMWYW